MKHKMTVDYVHRVVNPYTGNAGWQVRFARTKTRAKEVSKYFADNAYGTEYRSLEQAISYRNWLVDTAIV